MVQARKHVLCKPQRSTFWGEPIIISIASCLSLVDARLKDFEWLHEMHLVGPPFCGFVVGCKNSRWTSSFVLHVEAQQK